MVLSRRFTPALLFLFLLFVCVCVYVCVRRVEECFRPSNTSTYSSAMIGSVHSAGFYPLRFRLFPRRLSALHRLCTLSYAVDNVRERRSMHEMNTRCM